VKTILYQSSEDIKALDKQSYLNRHEVIIKILNPKDDVVYFNNFQSILKIDTAVHIYFLEINNEGRKANTYSTFLMHYAVRHESTESIDNFLKDLDYKYLTSWSLIAFLRTTYSYRFRLTYWKKLYELTHKQILEENLDPRIELMGLKKDV
jgi:hypothetical protein